MRGIDLVVALLASAAESLETAAKAFRSRDLCPWCKASPGNRALWRLGAAAVLMGAACAAEAGGLAQLSLVFIGASSSASAEALYVFLFPKVEE